MTWTYTPASPLTSKDEVRVMVGDTDTARQMVQDEEIETFLTIYPPQTDKPPYLAAASICDAIAGRFGREVQKSISSLSKAAQQQYDHYKDLAQQYRVLYATNGLGVVTGSMAAVVPAAPVLGGGGPTYLGGTPESTYGQNNGV